MNSTCFYGFWASAPIGVEVLYNGEIFYLSVRPVRPEAQQARPEALLARPEAQPASQASGFRPQDWLDGPEGGTHRWTDRKSPHSTGLPISEAASLLPPMKTREVEQGKGTAEHLMPLGYLLRNASWPNKWTDGWTDGRTNGQMDGHGL